MKTEEIFSHFSAILDNLLLTPFYKFYFQNPYSLDYGPYLDEENSLYLTCGATRGCIVDDNYDWVVKFITMNDNCVNACEREIQYYGAAKSKHLENYFVECGFLGVYRKKIIFFDADEIREFGPNEDEDDWVDYAAKAGCEMRKITIEIPLYYYKKAEEANIRTNLSKEEIQLGNSLKSPIAVNYIETAIALWNEYGENEFWRIDTFCRQHKIGDLHCANMGRLNGNLVIIDYASYLGN